jgi:RND family efflux transporter MFP subunit
MSRIVVIAAGVIAAAGAGAAVWATQVDSAAQVFKLVGIEQASPPPQPVRKEGRPSYRTVRIVKPAAAPQSTTLTLSGRTAPAEQALLSSRASGIVAERHVDIGDAVKAGDLLVTIDAPEIEQELRRARASVDQARARLALAEVNLTRVENLVGKGHASVQTVDERRAGKLTAEADLASALAEVQRLEEVKSFQTIRAPFGGTIVARHVERGDKVSGESNQQGGFLLRIARLDELRIEIDIPQSHSLMVKSGATARVIFAELPEPLTAKVMRVSGQIDAASSTMRAELLMPNPEERIPAGLNGQVIIEVAEPGSAVLVPTNTLMTRGGNQMVAIVEATDRIALRPVRVARDLGERVVIASGLSVDDRVVVAPNALLREGDEVQVITNAAAAKVTN